MSGDQTGPSGSDLTKGVEIELLADGAMLLGHVGQDQVILARSGDELFAVGATCTHYGGPLAEGLRQNAAVVIDAMQQLVQRQVEVWARTVAEIERRSAEGAGRCSP